MVYSVALPAVGATLGESVGADATASRGTAVATAAGAKGAWVQLIAATVHEASGIIVFASAPTGTTSSLRGLDIGVGGAGAEQVLIPDLSQRYQGTGGNNPMSTKPFFFPISVPIGSRISARARAGGGIETVYVECVLLAASPGVRSGHAALSMLGDSLGLTVDPGGTANTEGAWGQLSASLAFGIEWLIIAAQPENFGAAGQASSLLDIGIGGAGAEQVVIPNLWIGGDPSFGRADPYVLTLPVSIPAGTRVAARSQCSSNVAGDRNLLVSAWGVG